MSFAYIKRYQMLIDLRKKPIQAATLPAGFDFLSWHLKLLERHAKTKYLSFCHEMDAEIFPTFRQYPSCLRLMTSIANKPGFLPEATWLIVKGEPGTEIRDCATIQGLRFNGELGGIQNVAVLPQFRNQGLGTALVLKALQGFSNAGLKKVSLEVTAENHTAIQLYKRVGFEIAKTVYKEVLKEG